jgi:hypothetical protein
MPEMFDGIRSAKAVFLTCLLVGATALPGMAPAADAYTLYVNNRYGYEILYPSSFVAGGVSDSGDGQVFTSPAGDAELRVFAHTCIGDQQSAEHYLKSYRKLEAEKKLRLSYQFKGKDAVVVSGQAGHRIFYRKLIDENGWCTEFSFEYDEAQKGKYDRVTSKIAASLKLPPAPGKGDQT